MVKTYNVKFDNLIDFSVKVQGLSGPLYSLIFMALFYYNVDLQNKTLFKKLFNKKSKKHK